MAKKQEIPFDPDRIQALSEIDIRYTAPLRRGFLYILKELACDCQNHLLNEQHPLYRRIKSKADREATKKAITYLARESSVQLLKDYE